MEQEESEEKSGSNLVAKSRWKLLAKVLQDANNKQNVSVDVRSELSTTTSRELYGLFEWILLSERCVAKTDGQENNDQWFKCRAFVQSTFSLNIKFSANHFSINELTGFNNTGNVCIWPSEEVLAFYCLKHSNLFNNKRVIEIGGGMTCLASFVVAKSSKARTVLATDGNKNSVQNVNSIIQHNNLVDGTCSVTAQLLDWKNECKDMDSLWDVVLCADCLFFDDGRDALVAFMSTITAKNALIIIMAPTRGHTLALFLDLVQKDGKFDIEVFDEEFDIDVTLSHKKKLQNPNYNPDHNYPLLIHLRKLSPT